MRELLEGLDKRVRQMNASAVPGPPLDPMPYDRPYGMGESVRDKRQGRPGPE